MIKYSTLNDKQFGPFSDIECVFSLHGASSLHREATVCWSFIIKVIFTFSGCFFFRSNHLWQTLIETVKHLNIEFLFSSAITVFLRLPDSISKMTVIVWIAASVAVLYTLCFAARVSLAFEGGGPFPFEIEGFSHTKFSDKCFQDGKVLLFGGNGSTFRIGVNESLKYAYGCPNGYVVIQAESGSPNGAPLNASDFGTTAKIILAGAILPNERNDSLLDKACSSDFSEG